MKNLNKIILFLPVLLIYFLLTGAVYSVDPTQPPHYISQQIKAVNPLQLGTIFISSKKKLAIINGKVMKIGDQIDAFTLIYIGPNKVELIGPENRKEVLYLIPMVRENRFKKDKF